MTTVVWFKRDLRLADHPALMRACDLARDSGAPVLPLYVIEPEFWAQPDASARHYGFLLESLEDLRHALRQHGADLTLRVGEAVEILRHLHQQIGFDRIVSHEETGNSWTFARDRAVAGWCRDTGVQWEELAQCGVVRRLGNRDGWAAARNRFVFDSPLPAPERINAVFSASDPVPQATALQLRDDAPERQPGGRRQALSLLGGFLTERGRTYRKDMSTPLEGAIACSRLSPHLALGTLSVREAVIATSARQREVRGTRDGWAGSLKSFQSRLAWRDHFMQKLEDEPQIEWRNMHRAYDGMRDETTDPARLAAWAEGQTGVPFVDACMRSLQATGWLNFRMRSMVMSFASYHLWLHWRETGLHLARQFTDYEPGIHWSQVQMQSGTTGINTPRIYNPVKQGLDQDPQGVFTRRWLPELHAVPDALLQEPWRWEGAAGLSYPAPLVDVAEAARAAREIIWGMRKGGAHSAETARVVRKHASRKDGSGHFVNDRAPKTPKRKTRTKKDDGQLSFDL